MFAAKSFLTALAVIAAVIPNTSASKLHRRRCRATPSTGPGAINVGSKPTSAPSDAPDPADTPRPTSNPKPSSGCFPSAGFNTPDSPSGTPLEDWWCPRTSEYAFMGFSYDVTGCPSKSAMTSDFKRMRNEYGARYVREYGACDRNNFQSDVVDAAYAAGVGVYALVWFGFDGGDKYKSRLDDILDAVKSNPLAPYVIRNIAMGSEAMFDHAISTGSLVGYINSIRNQVAKKGIEVSTSDMAYQYLQNKQVLNTVDNVQLNALPFFAPSATTGSNAKSNVLSNINDIADATNNKKKICMTQTGWPSNDSVWKANSKSAVSNTGSEKAYFDLLDDLCTTFKQGPQGGTCWFAHMWEDNALPGWGVLKGGKPKFDFNARTHC